LNRLRRFIPFVIPAETGIQVLNGIAFGDANIFLGGFRAAGMYDMRAITLR
jgi:hypothetical protein